MSTEQTLFPEHPTLGRRSPKDVEAYLKEIGDPSATSPVEKNNLLFKPLMAPAAEATGPQLPTSGLFSKRIFEYTSHAFGYIPTTAPGSQDRVAIVNAGNIAPDANLQGQRISVRLDRLRVADYPGSGIHRVLVDFYAEHQAGDATEQLHFTQTFRVQEGQGAGIAGYPIFRGLQVGQEGVSFKVFTVNVRNDDDERALSFLESETFSSGLTLVTQANPAIAPLTGFAKGVVEMVLKRNRNVPVQDFYLGLDFSNVGTGARLAEGSFVAVQIPDDYDSTWRWDDWKFDPTSGGIVFRDTSFGLPYNYVVFSVTRYPG